MAVVVKYVVVQDGKDDMIFATKHEAEAYDKMLNIAERLSAFLHTAELGIADETLDALTFFMTNHRDHVGKLLKGAQLALPTADPAPATVEPDKEETPEAIEPKKSETSTSARAPKPRAA